MTMQQVPEGTAVSTQGQHYAQNKEGHADQRRPFELLSARLHFANWIIPSLPHKPQNFISL